MYVSKEEGKNVFKQTQQAGNGNHEFQAVQKMYLRLISVLIQSYISLVNSNNDPRSLGDSYLSRSQNGSIDSAVRSVGYQTKNEQPKNPGSKTGNYRGSDITDFFSRPDNDIRYKGAETKPAMYKKPESIEYGLYN